MRMDSMVEIAELKARLVEVEKLLECTLTIPREELLTLLAKPMLVQVRAETPVSQLKQFLLDSDTQLSDIARLAILLHLLSKNVSMSQADPAIFMVDLSGIQPKYSGPDDQLDLLHKALIIISSLPITHLKLANNQLGLAFNQAINESVEHLKFVKIFEVINSIISSGDVKSNKQIDLSDNELNHVKLDYLLALIGAISKAKSNLNLDLSGNKIESTITNWMATFQIQKSNVTIALEANQFASEKSEPISAPPAQQDKSPWESFKTTLSTYLSEHKKTYTNPSLDQTLFTLANIKHETPVELSELCRLALILYVIILNLVELYKAAQPELLQIVSRLNDGLQPITPYLTSSNSGSPQTTSTSSLTASTSGFFSHATAASATINIQDFENPKIQQFIAKLWKEMCVELKKIELDVATAKLLENFPHVTTTIGYVATPR